MSLLHVQLALDVEASHLGLELPPNFPEGWGEVDENGSSDDNIQSSSNNDNSNSQILELNTSRLQSSVSRAFERIGFKYTQEYVLEAHHLLIASNDDEDDDFIQLDNNAGFLSIDLADIKQKLGIEVDRPAHFINLLDECDDGMGDGQDTNGMSSASVRKTPMNAASSSTIANTEGYELRKGDEKRWQFRWSARTLAIG